MAICNSRCTCPGWILCPWNTHLFGNEWNTDCCALDGILFVVELVEGKAHLCQAGPLEFEKLSRRTLVLLLRMINIYFATGRYVILDSGFCALKGLIQLNKEGGFACNVINNRR